MRAAEDDSEGLRVAHARVDDLIPERASFTARSGQEIVEQDTLAAQICELEAAAAARYRELGFVVWAVGSLKGLFASGEDRASTTQAPAHKTLEKMFLFRAFVEGPNWIFGGERVRMAVLVNAELACVWLVITSALSESEGLVSKAICDVGKIFPVEAFSHALDPSAGIRLIRAKCRSLHDLFFFSAFVNVI